MLAYIFRTEGMMMCGRSVCILTGLNMVILTGYHTPLIGTLLPSTHFILHWMNDMWDESDMQLSARAMHSLVWICADHSEIPLRVYS